METKKIVADGIGIIIILGMIRTFDKKLAAAITARSAVVLIGSFALVTVGTNILEHEGFFK